MKILWGEYVIIEGLESVYFLRIVFFILYVVE